MNRLQVITTVILLLFIVSASFAQDSLGMRRVSALEYWQGANDIQMVGNMAYVLSGPSGLHIMNLSDPVSPYEIGRCTWYEQGTWYTGGFHVVENLAYIAAGGLLVFDISDPTNPVRIGQFPHQELSDIFVYGDIAVVEGVESYPQIYDVSEPGNIQFLTDEFEGLDYPAIAVGVADGYLCMRGAGLTIWDISEPSEPFQVSSIDTAYHGAITIAEDYAYFATLEAGLRIIDISNPLQPEVAAICDTGSCIGVVVTGIYAAVSKVNALHIWNIADPTQPVFEGAMDTQWPMFAEAGSGDIVCTANHGGDMATTVVSISDPTTPVRMSDFGQSGWFTRMTVQNTIGYIASNPFQAVDLSVPAEISVLARSEFGGSDFAVYGNYGYLSGTGDGILVLDISDPAQPESLTCYPLAAHWIKTAGDYLYAVYGSNNGGSGTLYTLSLENPTEPEIVNSLSVPNGGISNIGLAVVGSYIYYGGGRQFKVYSLADPAEPEEVGSLQFPIILGGHISDIVVDGRFAYAAYASGGLRIINISDPTQPTEAVWLQGDIRKVAYSGTVLITNDYGTIRVMDISDPLVPLQIGFFETDEWLSQITIVAPYLFTLATSQLRVYEIDALTSAVRFPAVSPKQLKLHPCFPNPFNSMTTISFTLPRTAAVNLVVYDINGRQVSDLVQETMPHGEYSMPFDGEALPSGTYFARLQVGSNTQTARMQLLK